MSRIPRRLPDWVTWIAFGTGLTGAVSIRLILIAKTYSPEMIRLFWYLGVSGNMCFFLFRTFITYRRRRLVNNLDLISRLEKRDSLRPDDYEALKYLISSLHASKERWNYFVIFLFSLIAIGWDIWINGL